MLFNNQKNWSSDPNYKQTWTGYAKTIELDVTKVGKRHYGHRPREPRRR